MLTRVKIRPFEVVFFPINFSRAELNRNRGLTMRCKAVAVLACLAALVADARAENVRVEYSPSQYLKNFALCACIAQGFQSDEVVKESRAAAGAYLEFGSFPHAAFLEAAALGKKFLAKEYLSIHGDKLTLMKCIDLFHSKELEKLARKYRRK